MFLKKTFNIAEETAKILLKGFELYDQMVKEYEKAQAQYTGVACPAYDRACELSGISPRRDGEA